MRVVAIVFGLVVTLTSVAMCVDDDPRPVPQGLSCQDGYVRLRQRDAMYFVVTNNGVRIRCL